MSKIILLGAAGQLGQALCHQLNAAGLAFTGYTRQTLDITNANDLAKLFSQQAPQFIINCAAYTAVDLAETHKEQCWAINTLAVANLAKHCQAHDTVLLHFSTDYVFDGQKSTPYTEEDQPNPLNQYGLSKWAGEQAIQQSQCAHYIIRTSWLYSDYGKNFYTTMRQFAQQNRAVQVVDDQIGGPTHANNLALVVLNILLQHSEQQHMLNKHTLQKHRFQKPHPQSPTSPKVLAYGLYHYCDQPYLSWYQFAQQIYQAQQATALVSPISSQQYGIAAKRPANSRLNCQLLQTWLNNLP
ncbi:dTDP-4-dehydrorhamnose reductase [Alishewanella sp. d11]|uniref:dTDP-4-dehydrorhamnose reductase n=1 Tax=Alishewanella sp. d11 TaxID=3414030 RepID=UPI003BF7DABC